MVQPIVALEHRSGQRLRDVRALGSARGRDSPLLPDFLQTAEETGAIVEIGASILRQSLAFATQFAGQVVSINVSWVELAAAYADSVLDACSGLP